jgi:hypothetical protein
MKRLFEELGPQHAMVLSWTATLVVCALSLALAVQRCGLRPRVRFSLLAVLVSGGLAAAIALNPVNRGGLAQANVAGARVGVTTQSDLVAIQQIMETIGPERVGGLLFHDDGRIEPLITSVPVERSGASKLFAVQFQEGIVKAGYIKKVVVFSGTTFQIPIGDKMQSVEVIASGDGDVLVATEDRVEFVNPKGDQSRSPIRVELILLARI